MSAPVFAAPAHVPSCVACGAPLASAVACAACGQLQRAAPGVRLTSPGARLAALLVDNVLVVVTLGLGWLVWSLVVWGNGQGPAKQILRQQVVDVRTGQPATWGQMALREVLGKGIVNPVLSMLTCGLAGLVLPFMLLWDRDRQEIWDKVASTVVVDLPGAPGQPAGGPLSNPAVVVGVVVGGLFAVAFAGIVMITALTALGASLDDDFSEIEGVEEGSYEGWE